MSLRHVPRQQDRDRPHDSTPVAVHSHPHPHLNGSNPIPPTPNGSNPIVSPAGANSVIPNGVPPSSSIIHKLNLANEQTWLLIGMFATQP